MIQAADAINDTSWGLCHAQTKGHIAVNRVCISLLDAEQDGGVDARGCHDDGAVTGFIAGGSRAGDLDLGIALMQDGYQVSAAALVLAILGIDGSLEQAFIIISTDDILNICLLDPFNGDD